MSVLLGVRITLKRSNLLDPKDYRAFALVCKERGLGSLLRTPGNRTKGKVCPNRWIPEHGQLIWSKVDFVFFSSPPTLES